MKKTIVVIGAGLAGLAATIRATAEGARVILVSRAHSERAHSVMAEGGINAALNTKGEHDSPELHYEETLAAGHYLADPNAVRAMTANAPDLVRWLHARGVQFNTSHGQLDQRQFGGQSKMRTAFAVSDTGKQLMTALIDEVRKLEAEGLVRRLPHHMFVTLLLEEGACTGCIIRDDYQDEPIRIDANAVIIATGGLQGLFGNTTGSRLNTGDTTARLLAQGIELANLEFIQYHPTTMEAGNRRILITEAVRSAGGRMFVEIDGVPHYYLEENHPDLGIKANLLPRDIVSRETWQAGKLGPTYLDMTSVPAEVVEHTLAGIVEDCKLFKGIDPTVKPIPVSPGIHYFMGGIKVDEKHRSSIEGVYAAGECCAQYHGANRLGGNSLLGAVYGGMQAALSACSDELPSRTTSSAQEQFESALYDELTPGEITTIQQILCESLGVIRTEETLQEGLSQLEALSTNNPALLLSQALIQCARARTESRGAHMRSDYPETSHEFARTTVVRATGDSLRITFEEIPALREEDDNFTILPGKVGA